MNVLLRQVLTVASLLHAAFTAAPAVAQEAPRSTPWVVSAHWVLDSGGHTGLIRSIIPTRNGKQIVSAGEDRTIRVWSVATGEPLRTIRTSTGQATNGRIYAMALSPDQRWLAAAGLTMTPEQGHVIQIYDFRTGKLVGLLSGHANVIESLAFSPNGASLASASLDGSIRLWDMAERKFIRSLEGFSTPVFGVGFTADGTRVVGAGAAAVLRLWDAATGELTATMSGHKDSVSALAVSPSDGRIASASMDGEIRIWDGHSGKLVRMLVDGVGEIGALSFSADGKRLLSSCGRQSARACVSHIWDVYSGKSLTTHAIDKFPVLAAAFGPNGTWAATGGGADNEIHLWDVHSGKTERTLKGASVGLWAYTGGDKGLSMAWDTLFDPTILSKRGLPAQRLRLLQEALPPSVRARAEERGSLQSKTSHGGLSLATHKEGHYNGDTVLEVIKDGKPVAHMVRDAQNGLEHRVYTFTASGDSVISGGANGVLTAYDLSGRSLGEFTGHEGAILAVAPSRDSRFLISSASDHTIRLWNIKTRELIASVLAADNGEWIMWTPRGFYACSPGADHFLGWRVDHGPNREADDVAASQLRKHLNRAAVVVRSIELASAEAAAKESIASVKLLDLLSRPVPKLRVIGPLTGDSASGDFTELKVEVVGAPYAVTSVKVDVNGRSVAQLTPKGGATVSPGEHTFRVPLDREVNRISVIGANDTADTVETVVLTRKEEGGSRKPSLSSGDVLR
jgi:WD40 repeat protein